MPTYEYFCKECNEKLEVFQKITEEPLTECPSCKKQALRRGPGGGVGLSFKGSGFYITDYAKDPSPSCPCADPQPGCSGSQ